MPMLRLSLRESVALVAVWLAAQALWLQSAYQLEFLGRQVFVRVWAASVAFFAANAWILVRLVRAVAATLAACDQRAASRSRGF